MKRIALAEDDFELRTLVAVLLREHDFEVLEAADGVMLLGILQRNEVSLVVTDLWMPTLGGHDVLKLRRDDGDHTPFLVITAATRTIADSIVGSEHVTVLRKPFTEETLLAAVEALIASSSG